MKDPRFFVFFDKNVALKDFSRSIPLKIWQAASPLIKKKEVPQEINLIFTDNPAIKKLNREFRGIDQITDVLSFNYGRENPPNQKTASHFKSLGEIYLSLPYLRKASGELKTSLNWLVAKNILHGILHLAGYNHQKKNERKIMETLEKKVLAKLAR